MTPKQQFIKAMKDQGFVSCDEEMDLTGSIALVPHHYKTDQGDHVLIDRIRFCIFAGVDTPKGGLGCITFYFQGVKKQKYHRYSHQFEFFKKAECYESAKEAIKEYEKWRSECWHTMKQWEIVL